MLNLPLTHTMHSLMPKILELNYKFIQNLMKPNNSTPKVITYQKHFVINDTHNNLKINIL